MVEVECGRLTSFKFSYIFFVLRTGSPPSRAPVIRWSASHDANWRAKASRIRFVCQEHEHIFFSSGAACFFLHCYSLFKWIWNSSKLTILSDEKQLCNSVLIFRVDSQQLCPDLTISGYLASTDHDLIVGLWEMFPSLSLSIVTYTCWRFGVSGKKKASYCKSSLFSMLLLHFSIQLPHKKILNHWNVSCLYNLSGALIFLFRPKRNQKSFYWFLTQEFSIYVSESSTSPLHE